MIEDLQDEYKPTTGPRPGEKNKPGMLLLVFIIWVIYAATMIIIAAPRIISTVKKTNALEILRNRKELINQAETTQATLYFVNYNNLSNPVYTAYKTRVKQTGVSTYHDVLEGLLTGPSDTALSFGSITMIPKGTKLNGVTVSGKTAFVDLSSDFIVSYQNDVDTDYMKTAHQQILKTLNAVNNEISDLVLLVNGQSL